MGARSAQMTEKTLVDAFLEALGASRLSPTFSTSAILVSLPIPGHLVRQCPSKFVAAWHQKYRKVGARIVGVDVVAVGTAAGGILTSSSSTISLSEPPAAFLLGLSDGRLVLRPVLPDGWSLPHAPPDLS